MLGIFFGLLAGMVGLVGMSGRSSSDTLASGSSEKIVSAGNDKSSDAKVKNTPPAQDDAEETDRATPPEVVEKTNIKLEKPAAPKGNTQTQPEPQKVADTSVEVKIPKAPVQDVEAGDNGVEVTELGVGFKGTAVSGRVKTFDLGDDSIAGLEILKGPAYGNVTVNPDNTLAIVLSGTTHTADLKFDIRLTHNDGSVVDHKITLDVSAGTQDGGWGLGEFYMLETDAENDLIVEHGENHRKVYISGDQDALTLADIAALENIPVDKITGSWLANNPEYGSGEDTALAQDAGKALWNSLVGTGKEPSSHWLLLESGHEYDDLGFVLPRGTEGESELHPVYVGAYGEGESPDITSRVAWAGEGYENIVIQGVEFSGSINALIGKNVAFDDVRISEDQATFKNFENLTIRNSDVIDVIKEAPKGDIWSGHVDRESGIYGNSIDGLLIEDMFFDHNGWADDYSRDLSADGGQPPNAYSHNLYLNHWNTDVTVRDTITAQASSFGLQVRSGGFIENNLFLDNNAAASFTYGGWEDGEAPGQYTLFSNNVITSGGYRSVDVGPNFAKALGLVAQGYDATLVDNIVTHLSDPNNPQEQAEKIYHNASVNLSEAAFYDDTIIYNWFGSTQTKDADILNQNIDGLDTAILDQTTIQNFTAQLLNKPDATITDLADYLRLQADGKLDDVVDTDLITSFFRTGFGLETEGRLESATLRFVPNELGEGVRWDNALNWSTQDMPGTLDGDRVELAGNWVNYGGTTTIEDLDFGEGGKLNVTHGVLRVEDHISVGEKGATLSIDNAGQFWTDGYTDKDLLDIDVDGGRFANTGLFTGTADLTATDNAQVLLGTDGADYVMGQDSSLEIEGDDTRVGFDGDAGGTGVLLMDKGADLRFIADDDGSLGRISEFFSGRFAGSPDIQSGVNLGEATLHLDLSTVSGDARSATLIEVDEIIGSFGDLKITGLSADRDASVIVDYDADVVTLNISKAGTGSGVRNLYTTGDESSAQASADLWSALTNGHGIYSDDPVEDIPDEEDDDIAA